MSELTAREPDLSELEHLRRENAALRLQLGLAVAEAPVQSWAVAVELPLEDRSQTTLGKASAAQDKVALFRSLFLTFPSKVKGKLVQYTGRVLREFPGKADAEVYDYADVQVPVLRHMGPGGSREQQEKTRLGRSYNAVAVEVHRA